MLWMLTIVGIKKFQQIDEVMEMTVKDFLPYLFAMTKDSVEGLAFNIDGKCETVPLTFAMWNDNDCPKFSASTALLIWMTVSGVKLGPVFPTRDKLRVKKEQYGTHISYGTCLNCIKNLCTGILKLKINGKSDPRIFSTHMLHKISFLFAYWGDVCITGNMKMSEIEETSVLQRACHSYISSTAMYLGNAATLKMLMGHIIPMTHVTMLAGSNLSISTELRAYSYQH